MNASIFSLFHRERVQQTLQPTRAWKITAASQCMAWAPHGCRPPDWPGLELDPEWNPAQSIIHASVHSFTHSRDVASPRGPPQPQHSPLLQHRALLQCGSGCADAGLRLGHSFTEKLPPCICTDVSTGPSALCRNSKAGASWGAMSPAFQSPGRRRASLRGSRAALGLDSERTSPVSDRDIPAP